MNFSPHVKTEIKRLKQQEKKTRDYLLAQVTKWTDLVPALLDMTWMNELGKKSKKKTLQIMVFRHKKNISISEQTILYVC
jgi:hypothetical protein